MPNETIIVKNYDLESGRQDVDDGFLGVDYEGEHYLFSKDDYILGDLVEVSKKRDVVIPIRFFKVINFNKETKTAEAEEVLDKSLIKLVAVELAYREHD
ncbi:MAG: hypothetical protein ABIH48_01090 [Candidatus Falkowbacteria bacterium]